MTTRRVCVDVGKWVKIRLLMVFADCGKRVVFETYSVEDDESREGLADRQLDNVAYCSRILNLMAINI